MTKHHLIKNIIKIQLMLGMLIYSSFALISQTKAIPIDDEFEDNDTFDYAANLTIPFNYNNLIQHDEDWYRFYRGNNTFTSIVVEFNPAYNFTLSEYLYPTGDLLNTDNSSEDGSLNITIGLMIGNYILIKISGDNIYAPYNLTINETTGTFNTTTPPNNTTTPSTTTLPSSNSTNTTNADTSSPSNTTQGNTFSFPDLSNIAGFPMGIIFIGSTVGIIFILKKKYLLSH